MNLFKRLEGLFFSPRPTFEGLAAKPVWIDAVVIALVALIAFNFIILPYAQKEQLGPAEGQRGAPGTDGRGQLRQDGRCDREPLAVPADHPDLRHRPR